MKKRSVKRHVLGIGDFFVDIKIKNMFGKTVHKEKDMPFYKALDDMVKFDKFQNKNKMKGITNISIILISIMILLITCVSVYKVTAYQHLDGICNPECIDVDTYSTVLPEMFEDTKNRYEKGILYDNVSNALLIPLLLVYGVFMFHLHKRGYGK